MPDRLELVLALVFDALPGPRGCLMLLEHPGEASAGDPVFREVVSRRRSGGDDGNGFSHMRSFLLKTSLSIPFNDGKLVLGTWQQIVLVDFDNRSRTRKIMVQMVGE